MINISGEQTQRISTILAGIPGGTKKALEGVIKRTNQTVRSETVKQITKVYAITAADVRAETNIFVRTKREEGGIIGTVSFSGCKIPLYRYNVTPKIVKRAPVRAAQLRGKTPKLFEHAFIAKMKTGHIGIFERDTRSRLPISQKMGSSTAQMAENSVVLEAVEAKAGETIEKRIEYEISRILNGGK